MNRTPETKLPPARRATRLIAMFALASLVASAADTPSKAAGKFPSATDVIAKHLKAIGGREAVLKHTSTRLKATWEMPAQSASGEFELLQARPNKRLTRTKLGAMGEIVNGYDGNVGWVTSPFAPPALMEGKMLDQAREDAEYYAILHNPTNYQSLETVARTQFDNRACLELKLITKSGRQVREFYDVKTGLMAGVRSTQETQQGPNETTLTCLEYQKFGDLLQVARLKIGSEQGDLSIRITSVEYDTVSDTELEAPAEIKALLKKP